MFIIVRISRRSRILGIAIRRMFSGGNGRCACIRVCLARSHNTIRIISHLVYNCYGVICRVWSRTYISSYLVYITRVRYFALTMCATHTLYCTAVWVFDMPVFAVYLVVVI